MPVASPTQKEFWAKRHTAPSPTVYHPAGHIFFASIGSFSRAFTPSENSAETLLDLSHARLHDHSALQALHTLMARYAKLEKRLILTGLSPETQTILSRSEGPFELGMNES